MTIQTGDKLPDATFVKVTENGPEQVNTADYFKGRRVALFSVPGAFTPTCSAKHLPGFVDKAEDLKAKGVDEIACTAVNDAFVMGAWSKNANAGAAVTMLADGNGAFADAIGLSRKTMRTMRQNLFWAFVYNVVGVPIAAGVLYPAFGLLLSPIIASAAMTFSSVSVIGNALRLRRASL